MADQPLDPIDRQAVERLMKRCQIGVGGRNALDEAHSILAECYGTLGRLLLECEPSKTPIKGGWIDGGYVIVTPAAGTDPKALLAAIVVAHKG